LIQKSNQLWKVQFTSTVTPACTNPIGIVSDGNFFYCGSAVKPIIFKFNFNHQLIDSFDISGMPAETNSKVGAFMVGLAYDGNYFYMVHGTDTIYQIDIVSKSVVGIIPLPSNTSPLGITYAPDIDGFWVTVYGSYGVKLFSRDGILQNTITNTDLSYNGTGYLWALAYDSISEGGPYLFALQRYPQEILRIKISTKKISAPIHYVADDKTDWATAYPYGIYLQKGVVDTTTTLGVFFMLRYHIGYDLSSIKLPDVALGVDKANLKAYAKVGVPLSVTTNVYNAGANPITSYHYHYQINNVTYTQVVTGDSIDDVYPRTALTHDSLFIPSEAKTYTVKIWFSDLNGNTNLSSDTLTYNFDGYINCVQRIVLHEVFTSSTCAPCTYGNSVLSDIFDLNDGKFACIKYQMSWPGTGDPYYTAEGGTRRTYYGVNSVPYLAADGNYYNGNPSSYTSELLNNEYEVPSFVNLNSTLDFNGLNTFNAKVTITPLLTYSGTNKLYVALVERVTTKNVKTNGETEFHYVFKKFMTSASGQAVALTKDSTKEINLSYIFKGIYRLPVDGQTANIINNNIENSVEELSDIILVYWIQDNTTKEVLQSGSAQQVLAINEYKSNDVNAKIYPNPSHGNVTISASSQINTIKVFNLLGEELSSIQEVGSNVYDLNINSFTPGFYFVQINTKDGVVTRKLSVK